MLTFIRRRKYWLAAALIPMLVWLLWPDRTLARVRALRAELGGDAGRTLPQDVRDAKNQELRTAMRNLKPDQRNELAEDFRKRATEQMERYHQLSPAEKKKELDKQIDRMEEMRKRMQQQPPGTGNQRPGGFGGPGGNGGPGGQSRPNTPEDQERRRQQRLDNSTPRERELRDLHRRELEQRRRERGLPPTPPFPPRGGR